MTNLFEIANAYFVIVEGERDEVLERLGALDVDEDTFRALCEHCADLDDVIYAVENYSYTFYAGATCERELGEYVVDEGLMGDIPDNVKYYLDYEAIGRDIQLEEAGTFTYLGYIATF